MRKVFQTEISKDHGNCMQAVVASLLEKQLDEVPNFIEFEKWYAELRKYFKSINEAYDPIFMYRKHNQRKRTLEEIAKYDGGIKGYLWGSVPSQTFDATPHAVVCDTDLNIVHDPNPNQKALSLSPKDVTDILTLKNFYIDVEGNFVEE